MKPLHILFIFLALIVGGVLWYSQPSQEPATIPVTNTAPETPITTVTPNNQMMNDGMMMDTVDVNTTPGNDVGMEYPDSDTPMPMMDNGTTNGGNTMAGQMKMFNINGTNYDFDVKEMRVKEGDTVMIHFMSADGFHDLVIDEFNVRTEKIQTGGMAMATFVASKKGTFEYYCSVGKHRMNGMVGKLIVE